MLTARWLLLALLLPATALADPGGGGPTPQTEQALVRAAALLSRYPAGMVPSDPSVLDAIGRLGASGSRDEVSLLRSLIENESEPVRAAASAAMADIRDRQRASQREVYAGHLPDWPELEAAAADFRRAGKGREEAICAAYAAHIFASSEPALETKPISGDAERLLANGRPRKALAAAMSNDSGKSGILEARALEDIGDVDAAVRRYAILAAAGDTESRAALDGFGVDAERLLLGLIAAPELAAASESDVLEILVRHGGNLTVEVLAERVRAEEADKRTTAANALARMLDPEVRNTRLPMALEREVRRALAVAAVEQGDTGALSEVK